MWSAWAGELYCAYKVSLDMDKAGWPGSLWICCCAKRIWPDFVGALNSGLMGVALASAGLAYSPADSQE